MTEILNKIVVNCETGEQTIVALSAEEIAQRALDAAAYAEAATAREAEAQALATIKASAKAKLISGAKLTAAEADTIIA